MKTATVSNKGVSNFILVDSHEKFGKGVLIGASKPNRFNGSSFLSLDRHASPDSVDGKITEAGVKKIALEKERNGKNYFFTITLPAKDNDKRYLVKLSTRCTYTKGSQGSISIEKGNPTILGDENVRPSVSGVSYAKEYLLIFNPGDLIKIRWEGKGKKPDSFLTIFNDEVVMYPWSEIHLVQQTTGEEEIL